MPTLSILDGEILAGSLPRKQRRLVQAWIGYADYLWTCESTDTTSANGGERIRLLCISSIVLNTSDFIFFEKENVNCEIKDPFRADAY